MRVCGPWKCGRPTPFGRGRQAGAGTGRHAAQRVNIRRPTLPQSLICCAMHWGVSPVEKGSRSKRAPSLIRPSPGFRRELLLERPDALFLVLYGLDQKRSEASIVDIEVVAPCIL